MFSKKKGDEQMQQQSEAKCIFHELVQHKGHFLQTEVNRYIEKEW